MHKTDNPEPTFHYICTRAEAEEKINVHDRFFVSNCGCREGKAGECERSRIDVCLFFDDAEMQGTGSDWRQVDRSFVEDILKEAEDKHLVTRPFRYDKDRTRDQGICFCCDDCCWYFTNQDEDPCDKGTFIEQTAKDVCTDCGDCVKVCYFKARMIVDGKMSIAQERCYGCGLCCDICSVKCIEMVSRG